VLRRALEAGRRPQGRYPRSFSARAADSPVVPPVSWAALQGVRAPAWLAPFLPHSSGRHRLLQPVPSRHRRPPRRRYRRLHPTQQPDPEAEWAACR
jgi:hypothetical protein